MTAHRIQGKVYRLYTDVRHDPSRRAAFCALAQETFGLDFENWYQGGWWTDAYRPYTLFDGGKAAANVSVNVMDFRLDGERKRFVQLGTVMTDPDYRGRGLSRFLMERVLEEYKNACSLVYLYANDSVLDFYPRFGFKKVRQQNFEAALPVSRRNGGLTAAKLDPDKRADLDCLLSHYARSNPFSVCTVEENPGLLLFYCGSFLKDCLWYVKEADAVLVAEREESGLFCYDVFGGEKASLPELLSCLAGPEVKTVGLGFTPKPETGGKAVGICRKEDGTMFAVGRDAGLFQERPLLLPVLSIA